MGGVEATEPLEATEVDRPCLSLDFEQDWSMVSRNETKNFKMPTVTRGLEARTDCYLLGPIPTPHRTSNSLTHRTLSKLDATCTRESLWLCTVRLGAYSLHLRLCYCLLAFCLSFGSDDFLLWCGRAAVPRSVSRRGQEHGAGCLPGQPAARGGQTAAAWAAETQTGPKTGPGRRSSWYASWGTGQSRDPLSGRVETFAPGPNALRASNINISWPRLLQLPEELLRNPGNATV